MLLGLRSVCQAPLENERLHERICFYSRRGIIIKPNTQRIVVILRPRPWRRRSFRQKAMKKKDDTILWKSTEYWKEILGDMNVGG
jgi:hypothetical protein